MVKNISMGQNMICGAPDLESPPPRINSNSINGTASELQASLSNLLSSPNGLNSEELLLKLHTVINENVELKETIQQNNMALRQQLGLLQCWNQQVEQQQQMLTKKNAELSRQMGSIQEENSALRSTLSKFKSPDDGTPKFHELDETIKTLNIKLERAEIDLQKTTDEKETLIGQKSILEGDITMLKCKLAATASRTERVQVENKELLYTMAELRQNLNSDKQRGGVQDTKKEIFEQSELVKHQEMAAKYYQELQEAREEIGNLRSSLLIAKEEAAKNAALSPVKSTESVFTSSLAKEMEAERKRLKDEASILREELGTVESALTEEKQKIQEDRMTLSKVQADNFKLKKDLAEARKNLQKFEHDDQYYETKLKNIQEQHDEATAKMVSYEELLGSKNEDIARLKKEIGVAKAQLTQLANEGETIAILRAQVEVYQSDFRAEREAREAIATEREKLRDELRHLHTRNTQLVDELEAYQRRLYNEGAASVSPVAEGAPNSFSAVAAGTGVNINTELNVWDRLSSSSNEKRDEVKRDEFEPDETLLYCPKCNKSFNTLAPLEAHVNRCLDED